MRSDRPLRRAPIRAAVLLLALAGLVGLVGCSDTPTEAPKPVFPSEIAVHAGDDQWVPVGSAVGTPPTVRIHGTDGEALAGAVVTFAVAAGGGSVTGGTTVTAADGTAAVGSWTLGPGSGVNTLTATVAGLGPVAVAAVGLAGEPMAVHEVLATVDSGMETPAGLLLGDTEAWAAVWEGIFAHYESSQVPALPAIDFDAEMVVIAAAGWRGAQGFDFTIEAVHVDGDVLRVYVLEHWPSCASLPAPSAPVHVVRIPRVAATPEFTVVLRHPECG
jgi:hypothetical protein